MARMSKVERLDTMTLVTRAQQQDESALEQLFERCLPRVRQAAALRVGRTASQLFDVEDVVQEALTDAFRNLSKFDVGSEGKFCNWLAKLIENRIRMALRAEGADKRGGGAVQRFADVEEPISASMFPGRAHTPSAHARGAEMDQRFEQAVLEMPERARELVIQRFYFEMGFDEIADSMGLASADSARSMYNRALKELSTRIA